MIGKILSRHRASSGSSARVEILEARRLLSDVYAIQLVSGAGTKGSSGAAHTGSLSVDLQHDANRDGWAMVRAASPQAAVQAAITGVITVDTSPQGARDWIRKRSGDKNFAGRQDTYDFDSNTHNAFRISGDGRKISLEDVASFPKAGPANLTHAQPQQPSRLNLCPRSVQHQTHHLQPIPFPTTHLDPVLSHPLVLSRKRTVLPAEDRTFLSADNTRRHPALTGC